MNPSQPIFTIRSWWLAVITTCEFCAFCISADSEETSVECSILYETPDGFFIDAGTERGVSPGDRGSVWRGGGEVARVEVLRVARSSALVRLMSSGLPTSLLVGDRVEIVATGVEKGAPPGSERRSGTLRDRDKPDGFVPLLVRPDGRSVGISDTFDLFHGSAWMRQLLQVEDDDLREYSITRLGSSGSWERIARTPWSLEWAGDVSYRDGAALEDSIDFQDPQLYLYRFSFHRRFDDESSVRIGRFAPYQLPGIGFVDGVHGEKVFDDHFRIGAIAGLKPTRERLDISLDEPTVAGYGTFVAGSAQTVEYTGTAGILGTLFEGEADRLAVLLYQRASFGRRLSIFSTTEADFDVGGAGANRGVQLTRQDLYGSYRLAPWFRVRAGLDHYQRPDTRAERDLLGVEDDRFFEQGYWRYWIGGSQELPFGLRIDEEVAFTDSDIDEIDFAPRWNLSLVRRGLPGLPSASVGVGVYNFEGISVQGYGGRVFANIRMLEDRLYLYSSVTFRAFETETAGVSSDFDFSDLYLRAEWRMTDGWSVSGGFSHAFGSDVDRFLIDLGVRYRW